QVSVFDAVAKDAAEPKVVCTVSIGQNRDSTKDTIATQTNTQSNDLLVWWLAKVTSTVSVADFFPAALPTPLSANPPAQVSGSTTASWPSWPSWLPQGTAPSCPTVSASQTTRTKTKNFFWNDDGVTSGRRQLQNEELVVQQVQEKKTTYTYDTSGYGQ